MSGMKRAEFGTRGTASLTFQDIMNATVGSKTVERRAVMMQVVKQKMTIIGFTTLTGSAPISKHFHRSGDIFTVPFEGEWNHFYFMFAYMWMNRIMNGINSWNSVSDMLFSFCTSATRGIILSVKNWFPPFTETFDDCWRDGAMKADRANYMPLFKALLGIFERFNDYRIEDGDLLLKNTATVDTSPRTLIFCDAVRNRHTLGDVLETLYPYYATIYAEEYTVTKNGQKTNEFTLVTNVEPWPRGVCQPGRKNANRRVRRVFQKSADLVGGGTIVQRAVAAGGGVRSGSTNPMTGNGYDVGCAVEVFIPSMGKWSEATITRRTCTAAGVLLSYAVEYSNGATYSKVMPENVRRVLRKKDDVPFHPKVQVDEGEVPFIIGKATNTKGVNLNFRPMSKCVTAAGSDPYFTFQEGGAGNNFRMSGGRVSAGAIGAIAKSPQKNGKNRLCRVVVLDGCKEASVHGGMVTFHPIYVDSNGEASVQLVSKPTSVNLGEPFDVDDIKESNIYLGCAGLCINGKKNTADGRNVSDLAWALQPLIGVN